MAAEATPRINARYLEQFSQQTVRIVGKVMSLRGEVASLEADGNVVVHLNRVGSALAMTLVSELRPQAGHSPG